MKTLLVSACLGLLAMTACSSRHEPGASYRPSQAERRTLPPNMAPGTVVAPPAESSHRAR